MSERVCPRRRGQRAEGAFVVDVNGIESGWFDVFRNPLIAGRRFGSFDGIASPRVAIVNEAYARTYTPGRSPIGTRVRIVDWHQTQVEAVLSAMTIRPLESDIERIYASIRVAVEKKGTPIGADSVAEFKRVPTLQVGDWLR
jgi:hypothetical protein